MRPKIVFLSVLLLLIFMSSCKEESTKVYSSEIANEIQFADGFSLRNFQGYSVLEVNRPWPNAVEGFRYVLRKSDATIPDSLKSYPEVQIPISRYVVSSTTHIPALELLGEVDGLIGFPGLDFISSELVRDRIELAAISELGQMEQLNTEKVLDLEPEAIVAFGMGPDNKVLDMLLNSGIPVIYNGDWAEQSPLGKSEWIKLFGALFDKQELAKTIFDSIVLDYNQTLELLDQVQEFPTVMSGAMYQDVWYSPEGGSWMGLYFADAKSDYLWKNTKGTGSLALSFEQVLDKAENADFWINPGEFNSKEALRESNGHYAQFKAFKTGSIYSLTEQKGATGGVLFYELGPSRPDLVLKDLVSIFHPELLQGYQPVFYKKLN